MSKVFLRAPYNYDTEEASNECVVGDTGPSLTIQSMAEDADLNVMMKRMGVTGKMPENPRIPTYQDFEGVFDFRTANEALMRANEAFMEYPANVRGQFENDPQKFLEFTTKEENREEMKRLGLLKEPVPEIIPPIVKVEVVNPTKE